MKESRSSKDTAHYIELAFGIIVGLSVGLAVFEFALSGGMGESAKELAMTFNTWMWKIVEGFSDAVETMRLLPEIDLIGSANEIDHGLGDTIRSIRTTHWVQETLGINSSNLMTTLGSLGR